MTRMTGPDCVVRCNLINTHTHTHSQILLSPEWSSSAEVVSSILVKNIICVLSFVQSGKREKIKFNHWVKSCKSAELASR